MQNEELVYLIRLLNVPMVSSRRMRNLLQYFKTPGNVIGASINQLKEVPLIDNKIAQNIISVTDDDFGNEQIKKAKDANIKIITYWDNEYPEYLKNIIYPPSIIFCKGDITLLNNKSIGVVGTRNPTQYGVNCTKYITSKLCENSITIVSGLAHGIDTIAHNSALENNGKTIAVLGSGVDIVYPKENKQLYNFISEKGLVISEYYLGTEPTIKNFPARNRIISGLSLGIVLIESDVNGGGMITAKFALDQNREVFAVPGNINTRKSRGTNKLIKEGRAKLVQSVDDLLMELNIGTNLDIKQKTVDTSLLSITENKIYSILVGKTIHIDEILEAAELNISEILVGLTNLELNGIIRQLPGKVFQIVE